MSIVYNAQLQGLVNQQYRCISVHFGGPVSKNFGDFFKPKDKRAFWSQWQLICYFITILLLWFNMFYRKSPPEHPQVNDLAKSKLYMEKLQMSYWKYWSWQFSTCKNENLNEHVMWISYFWYYNCFPSYAAGRTIWTSFLHSRWKRIQSVEQHQNTV